MIENYRICLFNKNNKLYVQYYLNGKQRQKSLKMPYTKENVKKAKKYFIPELEKKLILGEIKDKKKITKEFDFYASIFLRQKENLKKYKEIENIVINQFYPVFGKNTKIDKITRGVVRQWVDQKLQKVTPQRVKRLLNTLAAIFDIAIQYEHIETNPARNIILPPPKKVKEMKPFTPEEVKLLIENAEGYFKNYLAIAFFTGMRPGEIVALTLEDINLEKLYIDVNKRLKKGEINTPKTKSSIRKVPIPKKLLPYLQNQIKKAKEKGTNILFFNQKGHYLYDADRLHHHWKKLLKKCNIKHRAMYNTRHTYATLMIKNEVPIHLVSQSMGHKTIKETLSTYAKFLPDENLKMSRDIDILSSNII